MRIYRSMKPCQECGQTPTRVLQCRTIKDKDWTNTHRCYKHDPFWDYDDDGKPLKK